MCLTRFEKNRFDLQLCASIFSPVLVSGSILVPLWASISVLLCIGWVSLKYQVFHKGVSRYRGLIWFPSGIGGVFLVIEGFFLGFCWAISFQTLPLIFAQLAVTQWVSHKFYLPSLWNMCVSWGPFRFCVHILFSLGLSFHTFGKICKEHI